MSALSPEQSLVLAAIDRFRSDPDLAVCDDGSSDGDVLDGILRALSLVLPAEEIDLAVTGLLASHTAGLDEETQLVLEALLTSVEQDDEEEEIPLQDALAREAPLIEANALESSLLLVWDPAGNPPLRELEILELLEIYPCRGAEPRWLPEDFVALLEGKTLQWRRTLVALEILQERPDTRPAASTVILVVPEAREAPLQQLEVAVPLTAEVGPA
jgi:hypothetical protein